VLGALALSVAAILLFGGLSLFATTLRVVAYFPGSVAGLEVGAPVTFRGVKVGTVAGMRVHVDLSDLHAVIPVFMELDVSRIAWSQAPAGRESDDLRRAVKAGLRAQLVAQSLVTGQVDVDLDFHPALPWPANERPDKIVEIPTITSDIQQLKDELAAMDLPGLAKQASRSLASFQHAADALARAAAPLSQSVLQTAADARTTLAAATTAIRAVQADAAGTLANIDLLAVSSRRQVVSSGKNLDALLAQLRQLSVTVNEAVSPRSPMRGDLEASLRDIAAGAGSLRRLTRNLERNPAGTLFGHSVR